MTLLRSDRERGAALAELAMVAPLMLVMLLVVFDFGRGFHAYISVTNGARQAARAALQDDKDCTLSDLQTPAENGASPYSVVVASPVEASGLCSITVSYTYAPVLPFVTSSFSLPMIGDIGPLWDGSMSETAVSK